MWLLHRLLSWSIWNVGLHNCQSNTTFWEHILKNTMKVHFVSNFKTENCFKTWYQVNKRTFYFIQTGNIASHTREQKKNTVSNNSFISISKHWRKVRKKNKTMRKPLFCFLSLDFDSYKVEKHPMQSSWGLIVSLFITGMYAAVWVSDWSKNGTLIKHFISSLNSYSHSFSLLLPLK